MSCAVLGVAPQIKSAMLKTLVHKPESVSLPSLPPFLTVWLPWHLWGHTLTASHAWRVTHSPGFGTCTRAHRGWKSHIWAVVLSRSPLSPRRLALLHTYFQVDAFVGHLLGFRGKYSQSQCPPGQPWAWASVASHLQDRHFALSCPHPTPRAF